MREGNPEIVGTSPIHSAESVLSSIGNCIIVDSSAVCGRAHVISSYFRAARNMERGTAKGSSMATEFFRQLTGERQVSQAIKRARIRDGSPAVIISSEGSEGILQRLGLEMDNSVIRCEGKNCEEECMERSALVEIL